MSVATKFRMDDISSGAGMRDSPMTGPYVAAKAGMNNLTQTLAPELAPRIRVNTYKSADDE